MGVNLVCLQCSFIVLSHVNGVFLREEKVPDFPKTVHTKPHLHVKVMLRYTLLQILQRR